MTHFLLGVTIVGQFMINKKAFLILGFQDKIPDICMRLFYIG